MKNLRIARYVLPVALEQAFAGEFKPLFDGATLNGWGRPGA